MQNEENQNSSAQAAEGPAAGAAAAPSTEPEEEKMEESKEIAPDQDLSKIFVNLDEGVPSDVITSICMECQENGETRFMYTKIPMFKEIILSSFSCDHCGNKNNEVQFGGKLGDYGCSYKLVVADEETLNRSVVKSEFATIRIPELDFEIPPQTQKGSIKTVEGYLLSTIEGISEMQEERRKYSPQVAEQIDAFLERLKACREGRDLPFNFEVIDPSGNSFVQNPNAPNPDIACVHDTFLRSVEDYTTMGYNIDDATLAIQDDTKRHEQVETLKAKQTSGKSKAVAATKAEQDTLLAKVQSIQDQTKQKAFAQRDAYEDDPEITANAIDFSKPIDDESNQQAQSQEKELYTFPAPCPGCHNPGVIKMCQATIPYFKEIIIMAFSCDICGQKSTEIKQGGGISAKASKITFHATCPEDLNRDIFKSDSCLLEIPEIDLELQPGTLGSMYTTVEGVMQKIIDHLVEANPFGAGDSATSNQFKEFIARFEALKTGESPFTIILDDPLANCFIYNPSAPEDDPKIEVEVYDRTAEQDEDLGIADMRV